MVFGVHYYEQIMRYKWACLDLNQGPSGYEPPALTPELQARTASIARKSRAGI